jgi:glycosyltransferase involved in cell wall biosynthesis
MARVVFVNHLTQGSASFYRQEGFARCLRKQGFETTLVCRSSRGVRDHGSTAFDVTQFWAEPFPFRLTSNIRLLARAIRGADIVHINRANPYTATILTLARGSSRAAVVADMEDWDGYGGYSSYIGSYGPKGWALTGCERTFPRTADAVIVVSRLLRSYMLEIGVPREKLFVIHNGFDSDLFRPDVDGKEARDKFGLSDDPVLMYSSTFWEFERSQHERAFTALGMVVKEVPNAWLLLTGREESEIGASLKAAGIMERVVRPGFVPRKELPKLMAAADVAVHMVSDHRFHRASSPMIVPEYMAMGKPVVAPRVGELAEILDGGAGLLVDRADPGSIASAAVALLGDGKLRKRVGEDARAKATRDYSYEAATVRLREAYDKALS